MKPPSPIHRCADFWMRPRKTSDNSISVTSQRKTRWWCLENIQPWHSEHPQCHPTSEGMEASRKVTDVVDQKELRAGKYHEFNASEGSENKNRQLFIKSDISKLLVVIWEMLQGSHFLGQAGRQGKIAEEVRTRPPELYPGPLWVGRGKEMQRWGSLLRRAAES